MVEEEGVARSLAERGLINALMCAQRLDIFIVRKLSYSHYHVVAFYFPSTSLKENKMFSVADHGS